MSLPLSNQLFFSPLLPVRAEDLYAFSYNPKMSKETREIGWKLIDLKVDYQRMGIPNQYWEITDLNKDYEVILAQSSHFTAASLPWWW